jgi:putative N6-adenine-specific DNA methylase
MRPSGEQSCFASTTRGLEAVLTEEAGRLGRATPVAGGVEVRGAPGLVEELCLRLSTANRVLLRLLHLPRGGWREAARALAGVDLSDVAPAGAPLWLETTVRLAGAPPAPTLRAWLARTWRRPIHAAAGEDRASPGTRLVLRLLAEGGTLSADASGELLYRRGWRQEVGRAPLRETLAAGVLTLAGWTPAEALWDPMCGSGTLLVEAALRARRVAPGLGRHFAFEQWPRTEAADWARRRARARAEARPAAPAPLHGSDLNAGALGTTRRNARRAGVLDALVLERAAMGALAPGGVPPGLLATNLPYGKRVGRRAELDAVFADVGEALRTRFRGWRAALLTAEPGRLSAALERPLEAVYPLENGGLQVALCLVAALPASGAAPPR